MELASIEKLVEKYDNAETTLQEEAVLREYFASKNVVSHLQEYQMMFGYFQTNQDEIYTKTLELKPQKKINYNKWLSLAASVALLFAIYIENTTLNESPAETITEAQAEKTFKALKLLSVNLKKGNEAFGNLYAYENTVNKIFKSSKIKTSK